MASYEYALTATRGDRPYQEDAAAFWPGSATYKSDIVADPPEDDTLMAVLADGMGGHAGGATASQTACETFLAAMSGAIDVAPFEKAAAGSVREQTVPLGNDQDTTLTSDASAPVAKPAEPQPAPAPTPRTLGALYAANHEIAATTAKNPALEGMGTTFVAATFSNGSLEWISVGDSPLYLYRGGDIALLNEDHSLAPALDLLAAEGKITHEAARNDPRRHMLRSAVTGEDLDMIDISVAPLKLEAGDVVVLASDGIHTLTENEMARIIRAYGDDGCDGIAEALIRTIENQRVPHQDNATIMVIRAAD